MTPRGTGRCPKDRGDRSLLGKPFFKRVFLNKRYKYFYMSTTVMASGIYYVIKSILIFIAVRAYNVQSYYAVAIVGTAFGGPCNIFYFVACGLPKAPLHIKSNFSKRKRDG